MRWSMPDIEKILLFLWPRNGVRLSSTDRRISDTWSFQKLPTSQWQVSVRLSSRNGRRHRIRGHNHHFARDAEEGNIVPHNPSLLASFRLHHCLRVIHSEQCIGHVLKYCAKNSDAGRISL
jgi:hypothetical protein